MVNKDKDNFFNEKYDMKGNAGNYPTRVAGMNAMDKTAREFQEN